MKCTTPQEHQAALIRVSEIFYTPEGSPEFNELCDLIDQIEAWETSTIKLAGITREDLEAFAVEQGIPANEPALVEALNEFKKVRK